MHNSIESLTFQPDLSTTGSTWNWKKNKTYIDRFQEHMNGKNAGVYITKLIKDGSTKDDFKTELLGTYPKKECLEREMAFMKTSYYPNGLNGNYVVKDYNRNKKKIELEIQKCDSYINSSLDWFESLKESGENYQSDQFCYESIKASTKWYKSL